MNKALLFLLVIAVGASGAAYYFYRELAAAKQSSAEVGKKEVEQLVAQVGKLMILPEGEEPTVATVSDPERLKDQPFFLKAKQGDKVLIYTKSGRAILYDPVSKRIVDVAPIKIGESERPS